MFGKSVISALVLAAFILAPFSMACAEIYVKKKKPAGETQQQVQSIRPAPGGTQAVPPQFAPLPCTEKDAETIREIDKNLLFYTGPAAPKNDNAKKWQAFFSNPANVNMMSDLYLRCSDVIAAAHAEQDKKAAEEQIEKENKAKGLHDSYIKEGKTPEPGKLIKP